MLFLHSEVAGGEAVAVGEYFDGVVARGKGCVDIPVDADTQLFIGIFHLAVGGRLHRASVNLE